MANACSSILPNFTNAIKERVIYICVCTSFDMRFHDQMTHTIPRHRHIKIKPKSGGEMLSLSVRFASDCLCHVGWSLAPSHTYCTPRRMLICSYIRSTFIHSFDDGTTNSTFFVFTVCFVAPDMQCIYIRNESTEHRDNIALAGNIYVHPKCLAGKTCACIHFHSLQLHGLIWSSFGARL